MKNIIITQVILFFLFITVPAQENNSAIVLSEQISDETNELLKTALAGVIENTRRNIVEVIDSSQIIESEDSVKIIKTIDLKKTTFSPVVTTSTKYYISTSDGSVICLDTQGVIIWEYNTDGLIYSSLLKDKDLIITMTSEGDLFTINANNGDLVQVIGIGESIE
ncbi:MAG: PQQ-like beta-propeller repeat protein, partial [Ignavibacterium sp.]